ncbi:sugar transferase [Blautia sp. MSJ-19]|uniref:sugar transferase n=1 Tax=Blautia sp. MSJ-19 TaxID=2841517 RepID=UPI001C0EE7C7|nr:sugar transferase [Blautia sp. MSJ-19]MBU5480137.1 sugar transferase [Blautia sp. MSJ-19]
MPKISIITPAYNCEKYLEEAVNSVLAQTWEDWELLIIDDCSKDKTYFCMQRLAKKDKRIRIFQNPQNSGAAATRNYGIRQAEGEWVAFLDSDDLWREDKLEKQMKVLQKQPDAAFLFAGSAFIEDDGMTIAHVLHVPEKIGRRKLLGQNVISCSSVLIRRELMLKFPMPEEDGIHEDFATWLAILEKVPCAYGVDEPLLIYRRALASKSGQKGKSAHMNWQTYIKVGVPTSQRIFYMASYTFHGLSKYSMLWWRSYRLMMRKERFKKLFLMVMTAILLASWTYVFAHVWFQNYNFKRIIGRRYSFWGYVALFVLYAALNLLIGKTFSAFRVIHQQYMEVILSHAYTVILVNAATYIELALIGRWKFMMHATPMFWVTGINFTIGLWWSVIVRWLYANIYPAHEVLLIYDKQNTAPLEQELNKQGERYHLKTKLSLKEGREALKREILKHESVMLGDMPEEERSFYIRYCYEQKKRCYCQTSMSDILLMSSEKISLSDMTLQLFRNCGLTVEQRVAKRVFDILFSVIVLVVLSWLYLLIALYIKIVDGGSIFTKRECLTRNGEHFQQLKFRTIKIGKTIEDPAPWIRGGYFLMASHLDELPQFFNVLRGDMAVVGPYPELVESAERITDRLPEFSYRLAVKAGLTGYAKVHGKYSSSKKNQLKMDFYYIQNYSFAMDLSVIAATLKVLLEPSGKKKCKNG